MRSSPVPFLFVLGACATNTPTTNTPAPGSVPAGASESATALLAPRVPLVVTGKRRATTDYPAGAWVEVVGEGPAVEELRHALAFENVWGGRYEPFSETAEFDGTYVTMLFESSGFASLHIAVESCRAYCSIAHHYENIDRMQATKVELHDCFDDDGMTRLLAHVGAKANASFDQELADWNKLAESTRADAKIGHQALQLLTTARTEFGALLPSDLRHWYVEPGKLVFVLSRMEYPHAVKPSARTHTPRRALQSFSRSSPRAAHCVVPWKTDI